MPRPISATIHIASLRHNLDMVIQSLNNAHGSIRSETASYLGRHEGQCLRP